MYFGFSKTETNGTLVLIFFMLILTITPTVWEKFAPEVQYDGTLDHKILDSVLVVLESKSTFKTEPGPMVFSSEPHESRVFHFDPNRVSYEDLILLGLPEFLAKRVVKYRQKGGRFRIKSDLAKIYGLSPKTYQRLYPHIMLPEKIESKVHPGLVKTKAKKAPSKLDINRADTTSLKRIRGIGPVRARRIVKYRDWLGGFVSARQFEELWGFDPPVVKQLQNATFVAPGFIPHQLNIDTCGVKTLASHPYFSYRLAEVVIAYREQHGLFTDLQQLKEIRIVNDSIFERISPYLKKSQ